MPPVDEPPPVTDAPPPPAIPGWTGSGQPDWAKRLGCRFTLWDLVKVLFTRRNT